MSYNISYGNISIGTIIAVDFNAPTPSSHIWKLCDGDAIPGGPLNGLILAKKAHPTLNSVTQIRIATNFFI